jgi:hypothetical protein
MDAVHQLYLDDEGSICGEDESEHDTEVADFNARPVATAVGKEAENGEGDGDSHEGDWAIHDSGLPCSQETSQPPHTIGENNYSRGNSCQIGAGVVLPAGVPPRNIATTDGLTFGQHDIRCTEAMTWIPELGLSASDRLDYLCCFG